MTGHARSLSFHYWVQVEEGEGLTADDDASVLGMVTIPEVRRTIQVRALP